jgi:hypothetical protein
MHYPSFSCLVPIYQDDQIRNQGGVVGFGGGKGEGVGEGGWGEGGAGLHSTHLWPEVIQPEGEYVS